MSRPRVDKSSEWDSIKVILTKDQERSEGNKRECGLKRADALSQIELVTAQGSSMQPLVCVES